MKQLLFIFLCCANVIAVANTDSSSIYLQLGQQALQAKEYNKAELHLKNAIRLQPNNVQPKLLLATVYNATNKLYPAIQQYKAVIEKENLNKEALSKLATLTFANFNYADAITYAIKCQQLSIGTKTNYILAKSYYKLEDYKNSSKYLQAAAAEDPKNADIPYTMANIWVNSNNAKQAAAMYEVVFSIDSTKPAYYIEAADLYNDLGNSTKELYCYERAIGLGATTDLSLQTTVGMAYLNAEKYKRGMEILNKVIAKKPMDKELYNQIAYVFYEKKQYADAINMWDKIIQIDKSEVRTLYMIGMAFQKNGDEAKGKKLCEIAIAKDPSLKNMKKEMPTPQSMGL